MQNNKIVIDSNVWISLCMSKKLEDLEEIIIKKSIILMYSDKLISEITGVISRPKFRKYFAENISELLIYFFNTYGILIEITSNILICRDPDDNFLLNLAVDGNADYLITDDKDLLILEKINNTKIITIADFKLKL
jgi:uncharacterized protein